MKPDGIKTYYLYVDCENNKINDIDKWNEFAKTNNLFQTIGSDFHASDRLRPEIGLDYKEFTLLENEIEEMISNLTF